MNPLLFVISLVLIFVGSVLFTNGVEWLGRLFNFSEGVSGSILAAVGTALPETVIPLIAIFFVGGTTGSAIGIGAILGAPFMLGTLALFITGLSVFVFRRRRENGTHLKVIHRTQERDLSFFVLIYVGAVGASLLPSAQTKLFVAPFFVLFYIVYAWRVFKADPGASHCELDPLTLNAWYARVRRSATKLTPSRSLVIIQTLLSLVFIIAGAQLFVDQIVSLAELLSINAVLLSLVISPIATELPEKLNSVLWVRQGKDTLALGNITGAMVFQSCIPVTFGIAFTSWTLAPLPFFSALLALVAGLWTLLLTLTHRLTA
ncbi:MAG: sodium:calcium antiporter, partial [Halobacteriota archaeon]